MNNRPSSVTFSGSSSIEKPIVSFSDGSVEAMKWFAFLAMIGDHVNSYLFEKELLYLFEFGRLAMPIFAIVLGYNLARPVVRKNGYWLIILRLIIAGCISELIIRVLRDQAGLTGFYPFNIMFMLLLATFFCMLWEKDESNNSVFAILLVVSCGLFVEYLWPGILLCISAWAYFRYGNRYVLLSLGLPSLGLICVMNNNLWALASIPLILVASQIDIKFPRVRYVFYVLYPAHLGLILVTQRFIAA